jgi:ferredoxin
MLKGYRGFLRELARTGTWRAFSLQVRTGVGHIARRVLGRGESDPITRFFHNYGADGFRLPDRDRSQLQWAAEACLACGLCSVECARASGMPPIEPRDAVLSAARLEIDWIRLGLAPFALAPARDAAGAVAGPESAPTACGACRACERVCPVGIPIAGIQDTLATLGSAGSALAVATPTRIR